MVQLMTLPPHHLVHIIKIQISVMSLNQVVLEEAAIKRVSVIHSKTNQCPITGISYRSSTLSGRYNLTILFQLIK